MLECAFIRTAVVNISSARKKNFKQKFEKEPTRYLHRKFPKTGLNMFWSTYESFLLLCLLKKGQKKSLNMTICIEDDRS